jgi:hypothetical protein
MTEQLSRYKQRPHGGVGVSDDDRLGRLARGPDAPTLRSRYALTQNPDRVLTHPAPRLMQHQKPGRA